MTKAEMARSLATMLEPDNYTAQLGLYQHHLSRPAAKVRESYQRQRAIAATTAVEIRRHCQLAGLPRLGR